MSTPSRFVSQTAHRQKLSTRFCAVCGRAPLAAVALTAFLLVSVGTPAHALPRGKRPPRYPAPSVSIPLAQDQASGFDGVGRPGPDCRPRNDVLTYHGGDLVTQPDVFVIFWGSQWKNNSTHTAAAADLLAFYADVGTSPYKCAWSESGVTDMAFGNGTLHNPSSEIITSSPPSPLLDSTIQQTIVTEVSMGHAAPRTDNTIYVVVPPQGVPVETPDLSTGCGGSNFVFCGYHDSFDGPDGRYRYAVLPFPCTQNGGTCFVDQTLSDVNKAFEVVASHELAETVTDPDGPPVGNGGWFSDRTGNENADMCAADPCIGDVTLNGQPFSVNSIWSNLAKGCVDSFPCGTPPIACTDTDPGLCVADTGRAGGCALEWLVDPNVTKAHGGLPGSMITCSDGQPFCDFDGLQNGKCIFHVAACLNSQDPRPEVSCASTSVSSLTLSTPSVKSADATDVANAAAILAALKNVDPISSGVQSGTRISYSPPAATQNVCTGFLNITVPLRTGVAGLTKGWRTINLSLQSKAGTARNRITLTCLPPS